MNRMQITRAYLSIKHPANVSEENNKVWRRGPVSSSAKDLGASRAEEKGNVTLASHVLELANSLAGILASSVGT